MTLGGLARDEGTQIDHHEGPGNLNDAKKACDHNGECESFGFCEDKGDYYLFDKKITGSEDFANENDCETYYKSYEGKFNTNIYYKIISSFYFYYKTLLNSTLVLFQYS